MGDWRLKMNGGNIVEGSSRAPFSLPGKRKVNLKYSCDNFVGWKLNLTSNSSNSNKTQRWEWIDNLYKRRTLLFTLALIHYRECQCSQSPGGKNRRYFSHLTKAGLLSSKCTRLQAVANSWVLTQNKLCLSFSPCPCILGHGKTKKE